MRPAAQSEEAPKEVILLAGCLIAAMLLVLVVGLASNGVLDVAGALWWLGQRLRLTRRG
jgi:hypothetical protein